MTIDRPGDDQATENAAELDGSYAVQRILR